MTLTGPRRAGLLATVLLAAVYVVTMAPDVTFWDAGELIAAAHVFGIPHPPGTPLYIALGHAWSQLFGGIVGVARAMNLLSALASASACGVLAWIVARAPGDTWVRWGAVAGAVCAGLATSVWSNATETELYAISLFHVAVMLAVATRAGEEEHSRSLLLTAYLIALTPAVHLSALVGAPAAVALAARRPDGRWSVHRVALLTGVIVAAAGVGRMSAVVTCVGVALSASSAFGPAGIDRRRTWGALAVVALLGVAASALLILLVRARHDPAVNQGDPRTWSALADVVARRQYDLAPLWPRRAPIWLQLANVVQYADWQFAFTWGRGIFTTPARVAATTAFGILGATGWAALRRESPRLGTAVAVLAISGSLGVAAYLNLKAGASLGYGYVATDAHEARERDYFFVLAFWAWGLCAGYGAMSAARARGWAPAAGLCIALLPLAANFKGNDRAHGARAAAPRDVAAALLGSAPPHAMLFLAGDNDTYPIWYLQNVMGVRRDVTPVTMPLLPAAWYAEEIRHRGGLQLDDRIQPVHVQWQHELVAARIAAAARTAGRPIAASTQLSARERDILGSAWRLVGVLYVSSAAAGQVSGPPLFESSASDNSSAQGLGPVGVARQPDDVSQFMLSIFDCPRLGRPKTLAAPARDSLEVRCNVR